VEEAVLRPMQALYPPPVHLRGSEEAVRAALDAYRRGLGRFPRPALEAAWQRVAEANAFWTWPKLSELIRACEECQRRQAAGQDERIESANERAYAYTKRFMQTSQLASRARSEGWEAPLKRYVDAAAWVQGQLLAGCAGVGYSAHDLFDYTKISREEFEVRRDAFFEKAREQAARGHIRVSVPPHMVERWKRSREQGEGRGR
jgi:hypothetical protein